MKEQIWTSVANQQHTYDDCFVFLLSPYLRKNDKEWTVTAPSYQDKNEKSLATSLKQGMENICTIPFDQDSYYHQN